MTASHFVAIITHGNLGCEIKNVIDKLVHPLDHVHCYSNQVDSLELLEEKIRTKISEQQAEHVLLLADLVGGSCWLLANRIKQSVPGATVIGGLNIPLMISYHMNYENFEWNALIDKIIEDGKRGMIVR